MLDLRKVPLSKIYNLDDDELDEVKQLGITNVFDLLTWFPYKYKEIDPFNVDVQDHSSDILINGNMVKIHVKRSIEEHVFAEPCSNGCFRLYFKAEIINKSGQSEFDQVNKQEFPIQINFYTFRLNAYKDILKNYEHFKVYGRYDAKEHCVNVTSYGGIIKPFNYKKPKKIILLGTYHRKGYAEQKTIRLAINAAYIQFKDNIQDLVSESIRRENGLMSRKVAFFNIHFPESIEKKDVAIKTEKFNELYHYELKLQKINLLRKRKSGFQIVYNQAKLNYFEDELPFELTLDQINAKKALLTDLRQSFKMHRLLQGDVGSGKTVVAAFGILATISAGYQAALMTPTTILSEQHYATFKRIFKDFGINIDIMNGNTKSVGKRNVIERLRTGKTDLIIGTHSLFQKRIKYHKLGLAVIDEQQLFGVKQRKALVTKTKGCNVLSLTATPIPRTLATAIYKVMDCSIINHLPKGRKPIKTKWFIQITNKGLKSIIDKAVNEGGRVFVVTRLVKPSESLKSTDTITIRYRLSKLLNPEYNVENLHGKMDLNTKERVVNDVRSGKCKVLVATTIIGVGMDISNANLIIIYDAQDYGLAQLHQLRGRVGRNNKQARCILIGKPGNDEGMERLRAMEKTTDGFKLSRIDLKMRHSGNIFGKAQHGAPTFKLANLEEVNDMDILTKVQKKASQVVRNDWLDN